MSNQDPKFVVTGKVRLSYTHLFRPFAKQPGAEPKYSATLLIPKSDMATKQKIDVAINAAIQAGVAKEFGGVRPPILGIPIYDGDSVRPSDGLPFPKECKGHWVITASSKKAPEVVDLGLNPILNQSEVYSGIYARVSIRLFPYSANGKKGVGCGLNNVQKLEDGEPLGGGSSALSDFGGGAGGASFGQAAPAYTQQPAYGQPGLVYGQPAPAYGQPQQPAPTPMYAPQPYTPQHQELDPITGKPILGNVMGL